MTSILRGILVVLVAVHGGGKLKLASKHVTIGVAFEVTGTEFAKKEPFTVLLVGAAGRKEIGEVKSDSAGKFTASLTVPVGTSAGSYRLVFEASDDDEAARTDIMVMADMSTPVAATGMEHQHPDSAPSHEPLELARARSPAVTTGAWFMVVGAIAASFWLFRRGPTA